MEFGSVQPRPGRGGPGLSGFVDTSVLVRYLTGEPHEMAEAAYRIVDEHNHLIVTSEVIAETFYVLSTVYGVPRAVTIDHLVDLLRKENISVHSLEKATVIIGLMMCRQSGRVSIVDALIWAAARNEGGTVFSFDRRFPSTGVRVAANLDTS